MTSSTSLQGYVERLQIWKMLKEKGPRVNVGKTKIMICSEGLYVFGPSQGFPCDVSYTGVRQEQYILRWLQSLYTNSVLY